MPDQIERNLLVLLDPLGELSQRDWRFVAWRKEKTNRATPQREIGESAGTVFCFGRGDIIGYLLFRWSAMRRGLKEKWRNIFYVNDGLLSSLFDSRNKGAYRTFSKDHLPRPKGLRRRLLSLLPVVVKAERRYVVAPERGGIKGGSAGDAKKDLKGIDFMFFSNAPGKLLLARAETINSRRGMVFKTTANSDYAPVMEKEFSTVSGIAGPEGKALFLPSMGRRIRTGDLTFFAEEYVSGKTLREVLHHLSRRNRTKEICLFLDRLDRWFMTYSLRFQDGLKPLSSCYGHLFRAFSELYGTDERIREIVAEAYDGLSLGAPDRRGTTTIVAHNDLWPGNFIVNGERLIAIDWERATPDRAPFFDYYWMIISAVLEYHVSTMGVTDYALAFRRFLEEGDVVSCHGDDKLSSFLEKHGLGRTRHRDFLLLFLMEWSVQGYLALGSQTAMDRLAFGSLLNFIENHFCTNRRAGRTGFMAKQQVLG